MSDPHLYEYTGVNGNTLEIETYVDFFAGDFHSDQADSLAYTTHPLRGTGSTVSTERWLRVEVEQPFEIVKSFRFWCLNSSQLPAGWSIRYGTTPTYRTPTSGASSVAQTPVPTSDPGAAHPNASGATPIRNGTARSDYLVIQVRVQLGVVPGPGNALGFSSEGTPIPLGFAFAWDEA